ncbi:MAG TPA: molybdopterin-dependent oxidoreductase, partial [Firmicutes bacterium]|nr:molybdopterin-dependent oxidoreductase [Bacillota bacterium]
AIELIEVEYEEIPAVFDLLEAVKEKAPLVHVDSASYAHIAAAKIIPGTNICNLVELSKGDINKGFAASDYIFEDTFTTHYVQHGQIEPHAAVAKVDASGNITLWTPNDGPHRLHKDLADALGVPATHIRIISTYTGGGFGGKGGLKMEPVAVVTAMKTGGRPVKFVMTREEVFTASLIRHSTVIRLKTGVKADGTLVARDVEVYWDTGAYAEKGPTVCAQSSDAAAGPYVIPHVHIKGLCVYTNKVPAGAYRGYGSPQVTWAYESQMDIIAEKLGIDPVAIRLKNALDEGDQTPAGQIVRGIGLKECITRAAEEIKWHEPPSPGSNGRKRAKGIACTYKNTKTPSASAAIITLNMDGTANISSSACEIGQGAFTILTQIAAEVLGIPMEKISITMPDTGTTPYDSSTTSSRTTYHMGNAVIGAANDVIEQLKAMAAALWGEAPHRIACGEEQVYSLDDPARTLKYQELIKKVYGAGGSVIGRSLFYPEIPKSTVKQSANELWGGPSIFWMYGAHAVEVEIDEETGQLEVIKAVAAHDVGKAINPVNCCQQIEGGFVHGMGIALFEEIMFNEGAIMNANFHDYKIPTAMDAPREFLPIIVEAADPGGPFGAKGIGEPVLNPTAAAIANAVCRATGIRIKHSHLKMEDILSALQNC